MIIVFVILSILAVASLVHVLKSKTIDRLAIRINLHLIVLAALYIAYEYWGLLQVNG